MTGVVVGGNWVDGAVGWGATAVAVGCGAIAVAVRGGVGVGGWGVGVGAALPQAATIIKMIVAIAKIAPFLPRCRMAVSSPFVLWASFLVTQTE